MKIFRPDNSHSAPFGFATVLSVDRSEPACGSVRHIAVAHSPPARGEAYVSMSSAEPCAFKASRAPTVSSGHMAKERLAPPHISVAAAEMSVGKPCPPYSSGAASETQPSARKRLYASTKPGGVTTRLESQREGVRSPTGFNGDRTSPAN